MISNSKQHDCQTILALPNFEFPVLPTCRLLSPSSGPHSNFFFRKVHSFKASNAVCKLIQLGAKQRSVSLSRSVSPFPFKGVSFLHFESVISCQILIKL
ncbi:hypothetical protein Peur_044197 [Populus x canadensis]